MVNMNTVSASEREPATIVISGAGIVGLVLALGLKKHIDVLLRYTKRLIIFMVMWEQPLGCIRMDLRAVKDQGFRYMFRRWERHDGTEIAATASEDILSEDDNDLCSIGIRQWRLQNVLYEAVVKAGIPVNFGKATNGVLEHKHDLIEVLF